MTRLDLATNLVHDDEPCFGLAEVNRMTTIPGAGHRRFQIIQVIRGDEIVVFEQDMGPADAFKTEEFAFPGHVPLGGGRYDVLETVGRLRYEADHFRAIEDGPHQRPYDPTDIVSGFEEYATRRREAKAGLRRFPMGGMNGN